MSTEITATATVEDGLEATRYAMVDTADGREVGYLLAHASGLILNTEVVEDGQGEGIARALFARADAAIRAATAQSHGLYHVPAWGCTPRGAGFASAVGGDTMDDERAAAIVGMDLSIYDLD